MSLQHVYSPNIWPSIIAIIFMLGLVVFSYRHRHKPGALPFSIACLFGLVWSIGAIFEFTGVGIDQKIFWRKVQVIFQLPSATAITCFLLEYARPKRWLTRRNLVVLSIVPLMVVLLIITNPIHHLFWQGFYIDGALVAIPGSLMKYFLAYIFVNFAMNLIIFFWLFINSPQNRWPVVIMVIGQIIMRLLYFIDFADRAFYNLQFASVGITFTSLMYAIVFFRYRLIGPIPLARQAVIEQIPMGMLVLDEEQRVNSFNPAAERMLQVSGKHIKQQHISRILPAYPQDPLKEVDYNLEFDRVNGKENRKYMLNIHPLKDWRALEVGQLLLIRDVTEQRKAQAQLLEQGRVLATLQERELLARELHDDLAQVLAFITTQGQTIQRLIKRGDFITAEDYLDRLVEVAHNGEGDIRDSIMAMRLTLSEQGLLATLEKYLSQFQKINAIQTEIIKSDHYDENIMDPMVEVQVLRVLQEALTNIRKHAQAGQVKIYFDRIDHAVCICIKDDGRGFEVGEEEQGLDGHYGLTMMRERIDTIGGTIRLSSQPGQGTEIFLCVPINETSVMG